MFAWHLQGKAAKDRIFSSKTVLLKKKKTVRGRALKRLVHTWKLALNTLGNVCSTCQRGRKGLVLLKDAEFAGSPAHFCLADKINTGAAEMQILSAFLPQSLTINPTSCTSSSFPGRNTNLLVKMAQFCIRNPEKYQIHLYHSKFIIKNMACPLTHVECDSDDV